MRRIPPKVRTVIGVILIILAVVTGPVPLVQGWMFFLAAIAVLGRDHPIIKWCFKQMERGKDWAITKWCQKQMERGKEWLLRLRGKKGPETP